MEITTWEDACSKPANQLPPELREKVYEQLLIHPHRSLKPNGFLHYKEGRPYGEGTHIFISILQTCRIIYEEALPILYGKNTLAFHDFGKRVLPFPKKHLAMIKRVEVDISPSFRHNAWKMGNFLMTLGTSGARLVNLSIRIHMIDGKDAILREHHDRLPPLSLRDETLVRDHPIVAGLFSLKTAKKLDIQLDGEVRFGPGVISALKGAFMKEGTADERSITIRKDCAFPHGILDKQDSCPGCGNADDDLVDGSATWAYEDAEMSWRAVQINDLWAPKLKRRKLRNAEWRITDASGKARKVKSKAAVTKPSGMTRKLPGRRNLG